MSLNAFNTTSIIPSAPGWYCVFSDPEGCFHIPVVAWAINEDFQMLPMVNSPGEWVDVEFNASDIIYSPFEIPKDTGTFSEGAP